MHLSSAACAGADTLLLPLLPLQWSFAAVSAVLLVLLYSLLLLLILLHSLLLLFVLYLSKLAFTSLVWQSNGFTSCWRDFKLRSYICCNIRRIKRY